MYWYQSGGLLRQAERINPDVLGPLVQSPALTCREEPGTGRLTDLFEDSDRSCRVQGTSKGAVAKLGTVLICFDAIGGQAHGQL